MRMTIEPTEKLTSLDGVRVRLWKGRTEAGTEVFVFVHRIAVANDHPEEQERFARELEEQVEPGRFIPLRMILD